MRYQILSAEIAHETNTFSRIPTDQQAFRNRYFLTGAEAISARGNLNTELAGFLDTGKKYGWQIDHILSACANPSGKVTDAAFDWLMDPVISAASNNRYHGIMLGLHGAMVTESCDDGEAAILQRLRAVVGDEIPIAITLDLHANVSVKMCELANIIVSYKTYPHIDMRDAGRQAGEILQRSLNREIDPVTVRASCPMLEEVNGARTDIGPMVEWIELARQWEQRDDAFAVSINGGFASADIRDAGPTVLVTAEGDLRAHQEFADDVVDQIWESRGTVLNDYLDVGSAAAIAARFFAETGPLIIADYADNPGAGAYGDSTNLLAALLDAGVSNACLGPIVDGETVQQLRQHRPGDRVAIRLGGKTDPRFGGGPLSLDAALIALSNGDYVGGGAMIGGLRLSFGPSAVIRIDGIEVLVTTLAKQLLDLQQFKSFGIDAESKSVIALKSMQHFRADFEPIAGQVIVCDSGALCTPDYRRMEYRKVRRPIFPLDRELDPPGTPLPE